MEIRQYLPVIIPIVIGVLALGFTIFTYISLSSQVSTIDENLTFDLEDVQGLTSSLQRTITTLQDQITINQQNGSAASQQIDLIQTKLFNVSSQLNTSEIINSDNIQQISSQLQDISEMIQVLSEKVDAFNPQLPNSTLVIVENNYDSFTNTFTFEVENTQNTLMYVQLVGKIYSYNCTLDGLAGTFYSEIYVFKPGENTITTLDLRLGTYFTCAVPSINHLTVNFIVAPDIAVSPTYTFNIVPNMEIP
ncbi:hypothetical protein ACFL96_11985 [Thermoproteota archaeon]